MSLARALAVVWFGTLVGCGGAGGGSATVEASAPTDEARAGAVASPTGSTRAGPASSASHVASGTPPGPTPPRPTPPGEVGCPGGMAEVPGGRFKPAGAAAEVTVEAFCLDLREVTAGDYAACVATGTCSAQQLACGPGSTYGAAGKERHPITCTDPAQSEAFCRSKGKRLPTEAEWEWAARGGEEARIFPWGAKDPDRAPPHRPDPDGCWFSILRPMGSCVVGSFPGTDGRWGHQDLGGNVAEWTADVDARGARVFRGGGWETKGAVDMRTDRRDLRVATHRAPTLGVRCAGSLTAR